MWDLSLVYICLYEDTLYYSSILLSAELIQSFLPCFWKGHDTVSLHPECLGFEACIEVGGGRNGPKVNVSSIIPYKLLALSTLTAFYILPENILQVRVAVPHCMHKCSIVLSKSVGVHTTILLCICFSCESWTCVGCEKHISSWDNKHYPYVPSIILYFSTDGDGIFFSFISSCIPDFWDESAINYTCNKKGSYTYSIHANHW